MSGINVKFKKNKRTKIQPNYTPKNLHSNQSIYEALQKINPPWAITDPESLPQCSDNDFLDDPFSYTEFNTALYAVNKKSSPDMDGIDYTIF